MRYVPRQIGFSAAFLLFVAGCSTSPDGKSPDMEVMATGEVSELHTACLGNPCENLADCPQTGPCIAMTSCIDGCCAYDYLAEGTPCDDGCMVGGTCSTTGTCLDSGELECPDIDGNPCTVAWCDSKRGDCATDEKPLEDGASPHKSNCWDGIVCAGGEVDQSEASPTPLQDQCLAQNNSKDPFGCTEQVVCVDSETECKFMFKDDGIQCWPQTGADGGSTCLGHSCNQGQCAPDPALDVTCLEDDYPGQCETGCIDCTDLTCHWIPDPAMGDNAKKKTRYCWAKAAVGLECDDGSNCTANDVCAMGQQADGPLGKETLGECVPGPGKSEEDCLAELNKPDLPCILAGIDCDDEGGCFIDQDKADEWCYPPESLCFDKSNTYCTHLNLNDGKWDSQTGCHLEWLEGLDCDDDNPCTVDACTVDGAQVECEYTTIDGPKCDDGDLCTKDTKCVDGQCMGAAKCSDGPEGTCAGTVCDPDTGECVPQNMDGIPCDDGNSCTTGDICTAGQCLGGQPMDCEDNDICTDDTCMADQGCKYTFNSQACDDDNKCTTGDACLQGVCTAPIQVDCDDGNHCTDDSCNPDLGCLAVNNNLACDDDDLCTDNDQCSGGACLGQQVSCDDANPCTLDECAPDGSCLNTPTSAACNDGSFCTTNDSCATGSCQGEQVACNDLNQCTDDGCDPATGCKFVPNDNLCDDDSKCTQNDQCSAGQCLGDVINCIDENPCTVDSCIPATGCSNVPSAAGCDDDDLCTTGDTCANGTCQGTPLTCDDSNPCTQDSCEPGIGCVYDPIQPCCGNDLIDQGEECDDGNKQPGDGCDENCVLENKQELSFNFGIDDFDVAHDGSLVAVGKNQHVVVAECRGPGGIVKKKKFDVFTTCEGCTVEQVRVAMAGESKHWAVIVRHMTVAGDYSSRKGTLRIYDADCNPVIDPYLFESGVMDEYRDLEMDDQGNLVVAWRNNTDGSLFAVYGTNGQLKHPPVEFNPQGCGNGIHVTIRGATLDGAVSCQNHQGNPIFFYRFDQMGNLLSGPIQVQGTPPSGWYDSHASGMLPGGELVVLWADTQNNKFKANVYDAQDNLKAQLVVSDSGGGCFDAFRSHNQKTQIFNGQFVLPAMEGQCGSCTTFSRVTADGLQVFKGKSDNYDLRTLVVDAAKNTYVLHQNKILVNVVDLGGTCPDGDLTACDDDNFCTDDFCSPNGQCDHSFNSKACEDGDFCTTGDHCANGTCAPGQGQYNCEDDWSCTQDSCESLAGCIHLSNMCCGNGDVEPWEDCDNGSLLPNDGCDENCQDNYVSKVISATMDDFDVSYDGSISLAGRSKQTVHGVCISPDQGILKGKFTVFENVEGASIERVYVAKARQSKHFAAMIRHYTIPDDSQSRRGTAVVFDGNCDQVGEPYMFEAGYMDEWRDIEMDDQGNTVLVWRSDQPTGRIALMGPNGEVKKPAEDIGFAKCQYGIHVAIRGPSASGVVTCQGHSNDQIDFALFDANGNVTTGPVAVEGGSKSSWYDSHIVGMNDTGEFVVFWTDYGAQRFRANFYNADGTLAKQVEVGNTPSGSCFDTFRDYNVKVQSRNGAFVLPYMKSTSCSSSDCDAFTTMLPNGTVVKTGTPFKTMHTLVLDGAGNTYVKDAQKNLIQVNLIKID